MRPPLLDRRSFDDVLRELLERARRDAPDWNSAAPDDVGRVLATVYTHYVEVLLERLNRVPEKTTLAFLDLMGVSLLQPGAARTPVVFTAGPTATETSRVPRGTQVATAQTETDPAVIFETEADLSVVAALLAGAFTVEPTRDRYSDRSAVVRRDDELTFDPFRGEKPIEHAVYLGLPAEQPLLIGAAGLLVVGASASSTGDVIARLKDLAWEVWRNGVWQPLTGAEVDADKGRLSFHPAHGADAPSVVSGAGLAEPLERRWLRARATEPVTAALSVRQLRLETRLSVPADSFAQTADEFTLSSTVGLAPDSARIHVKAVLDQVARYSRESQAVEIAWEYFDGDDATWRPLGSSTWPLEDGNPGFPAVEGTAFSDSSEGLTRNGWMSASRPTDLTAGEPPGLPRNSHWLRASTTIEGGEGEGAFEVPPKLNSVLVAKDVVPEAAAIGTAMVDIAAPVLPFGPNPQLNATLYLASREALSQRGASITLFVALNPPGRPAPRFDRDALTDFGAFRLVWEYPSQTGWRLLGETRLTFTVQATDDRSEVQYGAGVYPWAVSACTVTGLVSDSTEGLRRSGELEFVLPADIVETDVAGLSSHWVRVRLAEGDYGSLQEYEQVTGSAMTHAAITAGPALLPKLGTGTLQPPVIEQASFAYDYDNASILPTVVTENARAYRDRTTANTSGSIGFELLEPPAEPDPTFYLGFDRPLPNSAVNLYFAVPPDQIVERISAPAQRTRSARGLAAGTSAGDAERLRWEYWNGSTWARLVVADDTRDLTEPGIVQFLGPVDFAENVLFGEPARRWLRVRLVDPDQDYAARLSGVFVNGVEAVQARTIEREIVGSSSGGQDQRFRVASPPIFPGQELWVREPERPPADEIARIEEEEPRAVDVRLTEAGEEIWVRWHEVRSFVRSNRRDRHYVVDRIAGEFAFGNGERGVIPPAAPDNIAVRYRSGGTARGNRPPGSVSQLKTSMPVIAGVTNPIAAAGGSERETVAAVLERGPQTLKHRGRAITARDYEWLARQASSTSVARAHCISALGPDLESDLGWVTLVIVPEGAEQKLLPSPQLSRDVTRYLAARAPASVTSESPAHVNVVGPGYVPVELAVAFNPVSFAEAEAVRERVLAAIAAFLHPLRGGPRGRGWELGRAVYLAEVFAVLEQVAGVEHVHSLRFKPTAATMPARLPKPSEGARAHDPFEIPAGERPVRARFVEDVPPGARNVMLTLFREGERVGLRAKGGESGDADVETTIRSISGNALTVDPFRATVAFPVGSSVASTDGASLSFLVVSVAAGERIEVLRVQGIDSGLMPEGAVLERLRIPELHLPYSGVHTVVASQD